MSMHMSTHMSVHVWRMSMGAPVARHNRLDEGLMSGGISVIADAITTLNDLSLRWRINDSYAQRPVVAMAD